VQPAGYKFLSIKTKGCVILGGSRILFIASYGPGGIKREGEINSPIAIPYAPAQGSGDGGIGSLFALNPDAKGGGPRG